MKHRQSRLRKFNQRDAKTYFTATERKDMLKEKYRPPAEYQFQKEVREELEQIDEEPMRSMKSSGPQPKETTKLPEVQRLPAATSKVKFGLDQTANRRQMLEAAMKGGEEALAGKDPGKPVDPAMLKFLELNRMETSSAMAHKKLISTDNSHQKSLAKRQQFGGSLGKTAAEELA